MFHLRGDRSTLGALCTSTRGFSDNLSWSNILVAGPMVSHIVVEDSNTRHRQPPPHVVSSRLLKLFMYDLTSEKAKATVRHVVETYRAWNP